MMERQKSEGRRQKAEVVSLSLRRFGRRLLNVLATLSLLLCLATLALWLRSYMCSDSLSYTHAYQAADPIRRWWFSNSLKGQLQISSWVTPGTLAADVPVGYVFTTHPPSSPTARDFFASRTSGFTKWFLGFAVILDHEPAAGFSVKWVSFPHWFLALLLAILPVTRLVAFMRRRRRYAEGHCVHCGYDLRATPQRCPECGTPA
jgi:hypothetical protein